MPNPFESLSSSNPFADLSTDEGPPELDLDLGPQREVKPVQITSASGTMPPGEERRRPKSFKEMGKGTKEELERGLGSGRAAVNYALTRPAVAMGVPVGEDEGLGTLAAEALFAKGEQPALFADLAVGLGPLRALERSAPEAAEHVKAAARPVVRLASDLATDPLTYAAFGKLPLALQKTAQVAFAAMAAEGVAASAEEMGARLGKEGLSPDAVEAAVETLLQAGVLYQGAKHAAGGKKAQAPQGPPEPEFKSPAEVRADILEAPAAEPALPSPSPTEVGPVQPVESHYERAKKATEGMKARWDDVTKLIADDVAELSLQEKVEPEQRSAERRAADVEVVHERRVADRRDAHAKQVAVETGLKEDSPAVQRIVDAEIDPATGLFSKPAWERDIAAHPEGAGITVSDMGGTKFINDTFGHAAGDRFIEAQGTALLEAAAELNARTPEANARAYRPHGGGDELAVLAATPEHAAEVHRLAQEKFLNREVELELSDGTRVTYTGGVLDFNFGERGPKESAHAAYKRIDEQLNQLRADLIARGERAPRGQRPLSLREVPGGAEAGGGAPPEPAAARAGGVAEEPPPGREGVEGEVSVGGPPEPLSPLPAPTPAIHSSAHLAYAGDYEYFARALPGEERPQVFRALKSAEIDKASGQREGAERVGPMDADTARRISAEMKVDGLEADEAGRLSGQMRVPVASMRSRVGKIAAEVVDELAADRDAARDRMHGRGTEPAAEPPPPSSPPSAPPGAPPGPEPPPSAGGPPPEPGYPKYARPSSINLWQRLDHGEDALDLFVETAKRFEGLVEEQKRGTITLAQTQQLASLLGSTDEAVARALARRPGKAFNAEQLWAVNEGLKETARATVEHARSYLAVPEAQRTPQMEADLVASLARHTAVFAQVAGANSEAGRALGILNRLRAAGESAAKMQEVIDTYGRSRGNAKQNLSVIADLLAKIPEDDVRAQGQFVRKVFAPTYYDKIYEYWINALLSGPPTHVSNALSGVLGSVLYPVELGLAATADAARYKLERMIKGEGAARTTYFPAALQAAKQLLGALDAPLAVAEKMGLARSKVLPEDVPYVAFNRGLREALATSLQAFASEQHQVGATTRTAEMQPHGGAIGGKLGRGLRTPTRLLLATDQFFQALIYRMSRNAQAMNQALGEGLTLRSDIADRMAQLLQEGGGAHDKAVHEAAYRTFNDEPGALTQSALRFKRDHPWLGWIIPFMNTPSRIVSFGVERAPFVSHGSFGKNLWDYARGKGSAEKLGESGAKAMVGTAVLLGVASLVSEGAISGAGPKDPAERKTKEATGWKPYSIKIGNDWYSYSRIEPIGLTMRMTADFVEAQQRGEVQPEDMPGQIVYALTRNLMDLPMISGLSGVFKVMSDAERYGKGWALKTASSLLPGLFGYGNRALDRERRVPESLLQSIASKTPGGGKIVEALGGEDPQEFARALDIYGRPELLEDTWYERFASPFHRSPVQADKVTPHLQRLGINLGSPSKKLDDWNDPSTGKPLPQPQGRDAEVLAQARGIARYALVAMLVSEQDFALAPKDVQEEAIRRQLARGSAVITRRAKGLLYAKQPLTLQELVGELLDQGPPALQ